TLTCSASRSGSAYTATDAKPASLHARAMRTAISPRFAIRTLRTSLPGQDVTGLQCVTAIECQSQSRGRVPSALRQSALPDGGGCAAHDRHRELGDPIEHLRDVRLFEQRAVIAGHVGGAEARVRTDRPPTEEWVAEHLLRGARGEQQLGERGRGGQVVPGECPAAMPLEQGGL